MATHAVKSEERGIGQQRDYRSGRRNRPAGFRDGCGRARIHARRARRNEAGNLPSKDDVISTTTVVIATVFFFGLFLAVVDWLVQRGVAYVFKIFGV